MTFNIRFSHPLSVQISTFTHTYVWICVHPRLCTAAFEQLAQNQSVFWSSIYIVCISIAAVGEGDPCFWKPLMPAAQCSAACLGGIGPWAAPATLHGCCGAAELQPSKMSRERGLLALFVTVSMTSSCCICVTPRYPRTCAARQEVGLFPGDWDGASSFQPMKTAWLLFKLPQVAMIFLKDLSMCRSELIS